MILSHAIGDVAGIFGIENPGYSTGNHEAFLVVEAIGTLAPCEFVIRIARPFLGNGQTDRDRQKQHP